VGGACIGILFFVGIGLPMAAGGFDALISGSPARWQPRHNRQGAVRETRARYAAPAADHPRRIGAAGYLRPFCYGDSTSLAQPSGRSDPVSVGRVGELRGDAMILSRDVLQTVVSPDRAPQGTDQLGALWNGVF